MKVNINDLTFGAEIELEHICTFDAAIAVASVIGGTPILTGGYYGKYEIKDSQGRTWTTMFDGSLNDGCETVTPPLHFSDIETVQAVLRALRSAGGREASNAGIHIHVDGSRHTPKTLCQLARQVAAKEPMLMHALGVDSRRSNYTRTITDRFVRAIKHNHQTFDSIRKAWYENVDAGAGCETTHYHSSRYHGLNLHSFFNGIGTTEFRWFNSTTHAGKLRAYITLCLSLVVRSLNAGAVSAKPTTNWTRNAFCAWLRQKLEIRDKNVRKHLLERFARRTIAA